LEKFWGNESTVSKKAELESNRANCDIDKIIIKALIRLDKSKKAVREKLAMDNKDILNKFYNVINSMPDPNNAIKYGDFGQDSDSSTHIKFDDDGILSSMDGDILNGYYLSSGELNDNFPLVTDHYDVYSADKYFKNSVSKKKKILFIVTKELYGCRITDDERRIKDADKNTDVENWIVNGLYEIINSMKIFYKDIIKDVDGVKDDIISLAADLLLINDAICVIENTPRKGYDTEKHKRYKGKYIREHRENSIKYLFDNFAVQESGTSEYDITEFSYDEEKLQHVYNDICKEDNLDVDKYIEYRIKQAEYEHYRKHNASFLDDDGIYIKFAQSIKKRNRKYSSTPLNNLLESENKFYYPTWATFINGEYAYMYGKQKYKIIIHTNKRKELDQALRIHAALKQERNNCNHASNKGKRVPTEYIRRLIMLYVQLCQELYDTCQKKQ
jgi:hypothetical protein